jgi:metal-responsive CopG/Arc/MetJ family transcriptional regulator
MSSKPKMKTIRITLPEGLIKAVDTTFDHTDFSRSQIIGIILERYLRGHIANVKLSNAAKEYIASNHNPYSISYIK